MSLDIIFTENGHKDYNSYCGSIVMIDDSNEVKDYFINVTHNLNMMAEHVPIGNTNLYEVLWHGNELKDPIVKGNNLRIIYTTALVTWSALCLSY